MLERRSIPTKCVQNFSPAAVIAAQHGLAFALTFVCIGCSFAQSQDALPVRQTKWTTSSVKGTPDPPLPFTATRIFKNVALDQPKDMIWLPQANQWIATNRGSKIVRFANDPDSATLAPFLDMSEVLGSEVRLVYCVLFHPDLEKHPWLYITFAQKPQDPNGVALGRVKVLDASIPKVDASSFQLIATWSSEGHVGSAMRFGSDGMLYLSIGDGQRPYPPDAKSVGQDRSNLQSTIVRIDVNHSTPEQPYRIPPDNPFVGQENVRGEIWAYGFRNPWKIAFDPNSGDLLTGDVGWEMREMIHRVLPGRNHGWSIMEGSQNVKQDEQPEIPITPPLFEHTHVDSRSITGGEFWQSDRIPELKGAYIYGDWMTGKVWALKHEGDEVLWQKELVDTPLQIICFALTADGEVLIVGYDGTVMRLDPNPQQANENPFPRLLSQTGLFENIILQKPAAGVIEYQINANHWADGTESRQWIAVPNDQQLSLYKKSDWQTGDTAGRFNFPADTVLVKTVSYLTDVSDSRSRRRLETQLLHRHLDDWLAYNYVWNDEQTDAVLQDDIATERKLVIKDDDADEGQRTQTWRHSSRSECILCHIWAAGSVHGFWPEQLNLNLADVDPDAAAVNQLDRMTDLGMFSEPIEHKPPMASPYDAERSLEDRARAWLGLNCSTCHRKQGGGTANFSFDWVNTIQENNFVDEPPAQGTFGIPNAKVVASGDPLRSVLLYRALKSGRGHMPQFGSNVIDMDGIRLLHDWIASMPSGSSTTETGADVSVTRKIATLSSLGDPEPTIQSLLETTSGAMGLSLACSETEIESSLRDQIVSLGTKHPSIEIRDLFEHYLPEDQRIKRLGPTVDAKALLAIEGSVKRGRELFEFDKSTNCRACHRIGQVGQNVGPDLSGLGAKQKPEEILASILNPSEKIDVKYRARQILTIDGKAITGIVLNENEDQLTIVDATGKKQAVSVDDIDLMQPAKKSAMPEQLLSGMTSQQAADLLAYLSDQRANVPDAK